MSAPGLRNPTPTLGEVSQRLAHMPGCRSIGGAFFLNDFDPHGRGGWAERAADLGWDTLALFGCHPTRPLDHLNGAGLLWRISGGKITAMQSDWATIEIDGAQRIIHRRPAPANFVRPWRRPS